MQHSAANSCRFPHHRFFPFCSYLGCGFSTWSVWVLGGGQCRNQPAGRFGGAVQGWPWERVWGDAELRCGAFGTRVTTAPKGTALGDPAGDIS